MVRDTGAWSIPATLPTETSLVSSVARARASSSPRTWRSMSAPLISMAGNRRAASRRLLAPTTGSPARKAMAVGPSSSPVTPSRPASTAARRAKVFFTTLNSAPAP